ncbi:FecR family protein [Pacificispira sp.]|uniref:FecR family protein n=1 Tax=Pacificispira sp. TaxID=2888761 RepID=UPI003BAA0C77
MSDDVLYDGSGNQIAQTSGESGGDPIGFVMTSTGTVTVERADGSVEQLSAGDPVFEDDILTTGEGSTVGIRFQDESRFSLGEEGRMELDTFVYDAVAGTGTSLIDVAEGSFAFVSGMIAKTGDDAMSVQTPVATIGVRGTTVAGDVGPDGQTEVTLLPDTDGTLGEIAVFNQSGLQIMFDAFQRVDIGGSDIAPTAPRTIEPTELRGDIADTVRAIGADPSGGRSRPGEDDDGGGSDTVDEAAVHQDGPVDDIDIAEEIDVAESETLGGVDILEEVDMAELEQEFSEEDLAAIDEAEMERAAEEVAEIDVSAGGDRAVVRMADGTETEINASDLAAGKFVGPSGTVIDLDISLADATRIHEQSRNRQEESEEEEDGVRDAPNTFQNEIIASDLDPGAVNALGSTEQPAPIPSPNLPPPPQNAAEGDLTDPLDNPDIGLGVLPPDLPPELTNPNEDITLGIDPIPDPAPDPVLAVPPAPPLAELPPEPAEQATGMPEDVPDSGFDTDVGTPPPPPVLDPPPSEDETGSDASDDDDDEDSDEEEDSLAVAPSADEDDEDDEDEEDDDEEDDDEEDDDEDGSGDGLPVQPLDDLNDTLDNVVGGAGQLVAGDTSYDDEDDDESDDDDDGISAAPSGDDDEDDEDEEDDDEDGGGDGLPVQILDDLNDTLDNVVGGAGQLVAGDTSDDDEDDESDDDGISAAPSGDDDEDDEDEDDEDEEDDDEDGGGDGLPVQPLDDLNDTLDNVIDGTGQLVAGDTSDDDEDDDESDDDSISAAPSDDDDEDDEDEEDDDEDGGGHGLPVQPLDDLNDTLDNVVGGAGQLVAGDTSEEDEDDDESDDDSISAAPSDDDDEDDEDEDGGGDGLPVQTLDDLNDDIDNVIDGTGQLVAGDTSDDDEDDDEADDDGISAAPSDDDDEDDDDEDDDDEDDDGGGDGLPVQTLDDLNDDLDNVIDGTGQLVAGDTSENDDDEDEDEDEDETENETADDQEIFNLAAPQQVLDGPGDEDPLDGNDDGPLFGDDDLPQDSAANSPLTVENGLNFGDDTADTDDDDDPIGDEDDDGFDDDDVGLGDDNDDDDDDEDGDEPSIMEQLNLGQTVDDTQNLLDNFLHPEESDDDDASDNDDDETEDGDNDDDASADDNAALLGGVFNGIFGGNDDPPDDGNGVY